MLRAQVIALAARRDRSVSAEIRTALSRYLDEELKREASDGT
jgi:predicted transcriptional regulator